MRSTIAALFGLAALAAASDVHELTTDTFEPFVKENDLVLAECMYTDYTGELENYMQRIIRRINAKTSS